MTLKDIQMTDWEVEVSDDEQEATVSVLISQAPLHIKKAYIAMPWWRLGPNKFYFHKVDGEWLIYKHEYPSETGWYFEYSLTELMP